VLFVSSDTFVTSTILVTLIRQATWLVPKGNHSCGTAPDSHRTSLLISTA